MLTSLATRARSALVCTVLFLGLASAGCARSAAPAQAARVEQRSIYRLDFVLRAKDAGDAPSATTFTIQVADQDRGEMTIGRNMFLPTSGGVGGARYDVGLKVKAGVRERASDGVLLDVATELTSAEGSSMRKIASRGSTLTRPGAEALVAHVEDDTRTYDLLVRATRVQ